MGCIPRAVRAPGADRAVTESRSMVQRSDANRPRPGRQFADAPEVSRLPNGMTVVLEHLPWARTAALCVAIGAGSGHEAPGEWGVAHCLEHLLFKGTRSRSARQLMEAIESRGGYVNASTGRENTTVYARVPAPHAPDALEILADITLNATLRDLDRERAVIIEEILAAEDTPEEFAQDLLTERHWPGHPLGRSILGSVDSISALDRRRVAAFMRRWYTPSNMVLSVAGHFDRLAIARAARHLFGERPPRNVPPAPPPPRFVPGAHFLRRPLNQGHLCLAFPAASLHDPRRYDFAVLAQLLGGGSTSRLFDRIREREGLAYSVYAWTQHFSRAGVLGVYLAAAPDAWRDARRLLFEEIARLSKERPDPAEIDIAREQLKASLLMAHESCGGRAGRNAAAILDYGRPIPIEEHLRHYDRVTPESLADTAAQCLRAEACALLVLGPARLRPTARVDLP